MDWVLMKDCVLEKKEGALILRVGEMEPMSTPTRPKGVDINPKLADSELQKFLDSPIDGTFFVGSVRPGVGGAFTVNFQDLNFNPGHDRMLANIQRKFGTVDPKSPALICVVRGLGAPGTNGCLDGGGAGILEEAPVISHELACACMKENFGEIGIQTENGGRIGFPDWLDRVVASEWAISWDTVPPVFFPLEPEFWFGRPDTIVVNGWEFNCALTFEPENASAEILRLHRFDWSPASRVVFRDLEHTGNGERLNRSIGAVCQGSNGLFVLFYKDGKFIEDLAIPLTGDTYNLLTNNKSKKLISLVFGQ